MYKERITYLFQQYFERTLSEVELYELSEILLDEKDPAEIQETFERIIQGTPRAAHYSPSDWDHIYRAIISDEVEGVGKMGSSGKVVEMGTKGLEVEESGETEKSTRFVRYRWIGWAAAVLIVALGAGTWYFAKNEPAAGMPVSQFGGDLRAPMLHKATLTLANGSQVVLDSAGIGTVAKEGNIGISKLADGQIAYSGEVGGNRHGAGVGAVVAVGKNTLFVPAGSRPVSINLSDGSKVWLDAGSSLTYPVVFSGSDRTVVMRGQAYFEVVKDPLRKFVVLAHGISTEVLGTHFNVNSHEGEGDARVSLLEGSVRVSLPSGTGPGAGPGAGGAGSELLLKPGQQARLRSDGRLQPTIDPDMEQVMAWKNGLFFFERTNIQIVMRQLARCYDAAIVYQGDVKQLDFSGSVPSDKNISEVLKMLELTGAIHFRIDGKTVYITR